MNAINLTEINQKRLVKLAIRSAKEFIATRGINTTTRKGSKELELLIKKITSRSLSDREQATQIGQNVGEKIVELSRQKAKNNLDKGVVRQLAVQKEIFSLFVSSTDKIPFRQPPAEKPSNKAATPVMVAKSVEEVRVVEDSEEEILDEELTEDTDAELAENSDEELREDSDGEILEDADAGLAEDIDAELAEDGDAEIAENSDGEILEDSHEEISEESVEEVLEEFDDKLAENSDGDGDNKNLPELQVKSQEEQPVELVDRSEENVIDSSHSITEKDEEERKSQKLE